MDSKLPKPLILESPYRGDDYKEIEENLRFGRLCTNDSLIIRDESPFPSHLLYTQEGILDDKDLVQRKKGFRALSAWRKVSAGVIVYINRRISEGMQIGIKESIFLGHKVVYRWLENYLNNLIEFPRILTFTGSSGIGKTTICGKIIERFSGSKMIPSYTSRGPRPSDLKGEYVYGMSAEEFKRREKEFEWVEPAHGHLYGTRKIDLAEAFDPSLSDFEVRLMNIVPKTIEKLHQYLVRIGEIDRLLSFYLLSPGEEVLRKRLSLRGDSVIEIQKRISDCKKWDEEELASDIPYIFLQNDGSIEEVVDQIRVFFQI